MSNQESKDRWLLVGLTTGIVVALVGGALLFAYTLKIAEVNSGFICSFGTIINSAPIEQRAEQSDAEFRRSVHTARDFVNELNRLQECDPPALIRIAPNSKGALHKNTRSGTPTPATPSQGATAPPSASQGGGSSSTPPASSQPPPPSGGGNPPPSNPPPPGGPVTDVLDQVCRINALGVRVCL
jgi:hypothetical protein